MVKKFFKNNLLLIFLTIVVFVISVFLFLYKLESIPNGLYVDEAVSGYNSYSLLKTGKDEYGKLFPVALRYFSSFTPPLYAYVSIIPVRIFSLSVFSVRLLGAVSGILSVLMAYLFLKYLKIFKNRYLLILGTCIFAMSPWVVFYARVGYEVYFAFLLFIVGVYFSLKSLKAIKYLPLSSLFLSLSTYSSHTQKYLIVLWIPVYLILFYKNLRIKKNLKVIFLSLGLSLLILSPYIFLINTQVFLSKSSLFYKQAVINRASLIALPNIISIPAAFVYEFLARYLAYFSPKSLFFLPDPDLQRSIPELSVFYSWMVIPYLVGLLAIFSKPFSTKSKFLLCLLLISPIPAALTSDPFSTQRALPVFFPIFLIIIIGISKMLETKYKVFVMLIIFSALIYSSLMLWRSYFVLFPKERASVWGFGYEQLIEEIKNNPKKYYVIDQARLKPVYIEYAFYSKYNPTKMHDLYSSNFIANYYKKESVDLPSKLDNVEFRSVVWREDICKQQVLVGDTLLFSINNIKEHFLSHEFTIKDPRGEILFLGYETHPEIKCLE